jgi:hypothetical protein
MEIEDAALLKQLLTETRVLSIGVLIDGAPYVGLLPYAITPEFDALLIHASKLAKHSKGLRHGAQYSALIHATDIPAGDPLQIPRISLQGLVVLLTKDSNTYSAGKAQYQAKFPTSAQTFTLADFNLYALRIDSVRFVAGFGKIFNLDAEKIQEMGRG